MDRTPGSFIEDKNYSLAWHYRSTDPDFVTRFRQEARGAARMRHPNIVTVYDSFEGVDGVAYIVMEFVAGHDLADLLAREDSDTEEENENIGEKHQDRPDTADNPLGQEFT